MPKLVDLECTNCLHVFEYLQMPPEDLCPNTCPYCMRVVPFAKIVTTLRPPKTIVKGNSDYNERERARLEKRSDEHWHREGRDEAIERSRAQMKKYRGQ